jgi:glucan biosynthesis protein C
VLLTPPFAFQASRIGLYGLWFSLGCLVGTAGLHNGLLAPGSRLARSRYWWLAASLVTYNVLWFMQAVPFFQHFPVATQELISALLWLGSCVLSCFVAVALFQGGVSKARPWMNSLSRSAYVLYLVHYPCLTWMQYLLAAKPWPAVVKCGVVFGTTLLLSWLIAQLLLRVPQLSRIL